MEGMFIDENGADELNSEWCPGSQHLKARIFCERLQHR
jgi:hypothetical protein